MMRDDVCNDILEQKGFRRIGTLDYRIRLSAWWDPATKIQLIALPVGSATLLKGSKSYFLKAISEDGATWARDVRQFHDYLEVHFPEIHISFSHFRDVTKTVAAAHVRSRAAVQAPSVPPLSPEHLAVLQCDLDRLQKDQAATTTLLELDGDAGDSMHTFLRQEQRRTKRLLDVKRTEFQKSAERSRLFEHLIDEYQRKGSACCMNFSLQATLQEATSPGELIDAVSAIVKELVDTHRFQVHQKLAGGRLNLQIAEATEPTIVWIEEWLGGAMSPRQLERLSAHFNAVRQAAELRMMVFPDSDIIVDGAIRESRKLMSARVLSSLLGRLDRTDDQTRMNLTEIVSSDLPAHLGVVVRNGRATPEPAKLPIRAMGHAYISGITGSGKTFAGRVVIEECVAQGLNVLVLDPRNQSIGLLVPEDRPEILEKYVEFGMKPTAARSFPFRYHAPGEGIGKPLPADLGVLANGRTIVSFKGLSDKDRCDLFRRILDAVFERGALEEATTTKLIIVVEEAQRFTRKRVDDKAKTSGAAAETALDRTVREGRKYGCAVVILSQTIRDFAYDSASVRQNTNTKVFLHNSDREIDYANDFLSDGRAIARLPRATAIFHNAAWGTVTAKIRPPYSKVWEFSAEETRQIVEGTVPTQHVLSAEEQVLLDAVREFFRRNGEGPNLSHIGSAVGITSKRKLQHVVERLVEARLITTRKLPRPGHPRILEPVTSVALDETRTKDGQDGQKPGRMISSGRAGGEVCDS